MLLLGVSQEVAKNNAGILFGAHLTFSYPLMKNFALQNSSRKERNTIQRSPRDPPPSAGLKPHPSRLCRATLPTGEGLAKAFAFPFGFNFRRSQGERQKLTFSRKQRPSNFRVCKLLNLLRCGEKFCVHACMTPVFSGRTKLLYFALAKWANAKSEVLHFCAVLRDLSRPQRRIVGF